MQARISVLTSETRSSQNALEHQMICSSDPKRSNHFRLISIFPMADVPGMAPLHGRPHVSNNVEMVAGITHGGRGMRVRDSLVPGCLDCYQHYGCHARSQDLNTHERHDSNGVTPRNNVLNTTSHQKHCSFITRSKQCSAITPASLQNRRLFINLYNFALYRSSLLPSHLAALLLALLYSCYSDLTSFPTV